MSTRSPYIVGPVYDWALFLLPPALAMVAGIAISGSTFSDRPFLFAGEETTGAAILMGTIVHAHLVAVLVRSHGNPAIFRLHPVRFIAVPLVLWVLIASSVWLAITAAVVATFWDVWHSGAQTFGFARIYDRNAGIPPAMARRLDLWINQLLYIGPILGGATLIDHLATLESYEEVGATFFSAIPAQVDSYQRYVTYAVLAIGVVVVAAYVLVHWTMYRRGYRFSWLKVFLVATTGICSVWSWGFNTWGEAFFIMNLFHAVQYLGLVWAMERERITRWLRLHDHPRGRSLAAAAFVGAVLVYGFAVQLLRPDMDVLWALTMVVSLMHFWYDGFIWSVARKQV